MAFLFGCFDSALNAEGLQRLLSNVSTVMLPKRECRAEVQDGAVLSAFGGDALKTGDGLIAAIAGFPRWQNPELANIAAAEGHARALVEAFRRHGENLCSELRGAFTLAVIDTRQKVVMLALDRIGQRHLFYAVTPKGSLVFGSTADAVLQHPDIGRVISEQAIFDYIYSHSCPSSGSIYRNLKKLHGAERLVFRNGEINTGFYWQPDFHEEAVDAKAMGEALQKALFGAVARFEGPVGTVGAFLSGGLDSSTIAGALALARGEDSPTFSMGFPVEGYDEMSYARIAAKHFKTRQHEFYLGPDAAVEAIPLIAGSFDEPFGNSSALPTYFCARLARENGIDLMLGGDGGDELFAGNERYAKQLLFERYSAVPAFLKAGLEQGLNALPLAVAGKFPFNKAARYIEQAKIPLPDRLHDYNFLHRVKLSDVFNPEFLDVVDGDAPLAEQRDCYLRLTHATALNRMMYLDWAITLHDNDLVKVNRMCDLAGVRVAYPMLDDDVVDLSLKVPSALKLSQGKLRAFYKQAMASFLPEEILNKSKHGFGLPFGIWLTDHQPLRELAYDSVNQLKKRTYFKPEFIDNALHLHSTGHSAYYGELIWMLMMLELWFQSRPGTAAS